jgi:cation/acetate symporter
MSAATLGIFAAIIALTLGITAWAARRTRTAMDFYTAGQTLSAAQNGFALAGDWCSAAAFLGFSGLTALYGMDGALYALGPLVAFCTVLFLVAEPVRNLGRYTFGDVIDFRMRRKPALLATALCTIVVNLAYLVPQMAGGGVLLRLLLGLDYRLSVGIMGIAMILYVTFGGQLATSWVQIVKAVLMLASAVVLLALIAVHLSFHLTDLFSVNETAYGSDYLLPGNYLKNPFDQVSLALSYACGLAGLPHVMTRFYTVPDAPTARKSIVWVMFLAGTFFMATTIFGLAATHFLGQAAISAADRGGNLAVPLLAQFVGGGPNTIGGDLMLGFVSAVAVATILAVVAGLTLSTAGAISHDIYVNLLHTGQVTPQTQLRVARIASLGIALLAVLLGIVARGMNVAVLVILAICIAASANFPTLVLALFWRGFNAGGVVGGVGVGLIASVGLAVVGPTVMGKEALWPLVNPTLLAMPLGFLGAYLGSKLAAAIRLQPDHFDEVQFRAQTGYRGDPV